MNLTQKISQMTPKGADLDATDLIEVSTIVGGSYVTKSITGQELIDAIPLPPTGLTVGTTPIASGTNGRVLFQGTGNVLQQSGNLFWDDTNGRLGIGTSTPATALDVSGSARFQSADQVLIRRTNVGEAFNVFTENTINTLTVSNLGVICRPTGTNPALTSDIFSVAIGVVGINGRRANHQLNINRSSNTAVASFGIYDGGTAQAQFLIPHNGNVLINTTTDAGYKLDVNGTARINTLTIGLGNSQIATNTALGNVALNANTTGASNTAVGYFAMNNNRAGTNNTAVGLQSLLDNQNGNANTAIGRNALLNTSGSNNTAIGFQAGSVGVPNTTGENNIFLGYQSTGVSATESNRTWIGNSSTTTSWLGGSLLIGTTTDVASSIATFNSTTKGFLPPRMTTTQKNAIASPATGLQVYDTTLNRPCFYDGTTWITL